MKYIRFRTKNNIVIAKCDNKPIHVEEREFKDLNGDFAICEFHGDLPKHDILRVANVQQKTNENNETYLTCDLIASFIR